MRNKILFCIPLIFLFLFYSCEKPSGIFDEINYLDLINSNISLINGIKNEKSSFVNHTGKILDNYKGKVVAFYKNSQIIIDSIAAVPDKDTVIYSIDNNRFIANKDFYITIINQKPIFSIDNINWYYIKNETEKGIQGVMYDYTITSEKTGNDLLIKYSAFLKIGKNPLIAHPDKNREIITLKKGMMFSTNIKEMKKENLFGKILLIPQGTVLSGYHIIRGDFINSQYINGKIIIKAVDNIYLYTKNIYIFMISLDKKNWGLNIFSFDTKPAIEVYAKDDKELFFNISTTLNYNKDKVSIVPSILKIILRNK